MSAPTDRRLRGAGLSGAKLLSLRDLARRTVDGVRKGFAAVCGAGELPARADLERRGARWRPYRSVASWYLWRAAERAAG